MSITRNKVTAVLGTAVAIGGVSAGLALGQSGGQAPGPLNPATPSASPTAPTAPESTAPETGGVEKNGGLGPNASSVQVPNTPDGPEAGEQSEAAEAATEKAESAKLAPLAKVSQAAAEKAALAKVPGTVVTAELGDENGNVTWQVEVKATDGTQHEVHVDAGNGAVLSAQVDDQD